MPAAEILNADEIARIAAGVSYEPGHGPLLSALRERYPSSEFVLLASDGPWNRYLNCIVDASGKVLAENYKTWLTEQYQLLGSARAVWDQYERTFREEGIAIKGVSGDTAIIAAPYGPAPDAWHQLEIDVTCEVRERSVFDSWAEPDTLEELLHPITYRPEGSPLTPWKYGTPTLTNIRLFMRDLVELDQGRRRRELPQLEKETVRVLYTDQRARIEEVPFLEMYPDYLTRPPKELRFLQDWQESSAGRSGHWLCNHWWLKLADYIDKDGERWMSFTPQWALADGGLSLPVINSGEYRTVYELMAALENFDQQAGYPFSWFFYGVHGNRLGYCEMERVMEGIEAGKIGLPEWDLAVLKRWSERNYGF